MTSDDNLWCAVIRGLRSSSNESASQRRERVVLELETNFPSKTAAAVAKIARHERLGDM